MKCSAITSAIGCLTDSGAPLRSVVAHYEFRDNENGETILYKTRYTESDGITVITLTTSQTVETGICPLPFASEKVTYSLSGNIFEGWKQFYSFNQNYSEAIRDLQGNVVSGATEIRPVNVTPSYDNHTFKTILLPTIISNAHDIAILIEGGTVDVNGNVYRDNQSLSLKATKVLSPITITPLSGIAKIHYTHT